MKILDTLSQQKKELQKPAKGRLKLFVCGPTVYDYSHLGHARTYIVFDAFVKYLRFAGFKIFYLQNITDIDDKIIARAKEQKIIPSELAGKFEKAYLKDMKDLKITAVDKYARATKFIPLIIDQIERLIKKGHAYEIKDDGIYFDVSTFPDYGKLSKRTKEQAQDAVSRIDESINKRNKADFCLWKFYAEGEPFWDTPLGKGRPGWHIEDTAITEKFFGPQYDIHGGGIELKFPHHEAEIAQQEAASGKKPLVQIWMHTGFLLVNGEKMSKSSGNFITIGDFLHINGTRLLSTGESGNAKKAVSIKDASSRVNVLRMTILSNHYRAPFDYNEKIIEQAKQSLETINNYLEKLEFVKKAKGKRPGYNIGTSPLTGMPEKARVRVKIENYQRNFYDALDDDFNTPKALAVIFDLISSTQKNIWRMNTREAEYIKNFIIKSLKIFEISFKLPKIPAKIAAMARKRELYRKNKQFMQSDELRKEMEVLGYIVEDTPFGAMIRKVSC